MVSFDARQPGTSNDAWLGSRLTQLPTIELGDIARLVVIAAHPDDETLGAGGLIATAAAAGLPVQLIMVTDGAASHPVPDTTELITTRSAEVVAATGALGRGITIDVLGRPDGAVREERSLITDLLHDRLAHDQLGPDQLGPGVDPRTLVAVTWSGDGHRDHRVLGEIVEDLAGQLGFTLWEYPIWLWHWADPAQTELPWDRMRRLMLDPDARGRKRTAVSCYRSQITPAADGTPPMLHRRFLGNFDRSFEVFVAPVIPDR